MHFALRPDEGPTTGARTQKCDNLAGSAFSRTISYPTFRAVGASSSGQTGCRGAMTAILRYINSRRPRPRAKTMQAQLQAESQLWTIGVVQCGSCQDEMPDALAPASWDSEI